MGCLYSQNSGASRCTPTHGTFTVLPIACSTLRKMRPARGGWPKVQCAAPPVAEEARHERNAATDADDSIDGLNVSLGRGGEHERSRAQREAVGVGVGRAIAIGMSLVC
eukprot:scaffold116951_cov66-Phaeocystis_antarctica.AAC.4